MLYVQNLRQTCSSFGYFFIFMAPQTVKMKNILLGVLLGCSLPAPAQLHMNRSAPLENIPRSGYNKVVLLKNGKTAYVRFTGNGALHVNIYAQDHNTVQHSDITGTGWDAASADNTLVDCTYELNGELVIFLRKVEDKHVTLFRLRVNELDGKLIKQDILATKKQDPRPVAAVTPGLGLGSKGPAILGSGLGRSTISVVKDPYSDCYAVIFVDNLNDGDDAIKVMHYDGSHRLLSESHMYGPDHPDNYPFYIDAAVWGNRSVFVAGYAEGDRSSHSKIYMYRLNAGDTAFTTRPLGYTDDFQSTVGQLCYNKGTNQLELLTSTYSGKKLLSAKMDHKSFLAYIDVATMDVRSVCPVDDKKINDFATGTLGINADLAGASQGMTINSRNETIVYRQEVKDKPIQGGYSTTNTMILGDIGLAIFDADNKETADYLLPFKRLETATIPDMYMRQSERGLIYANSADYVIKYIPGRENDYVLVNNFRKSIEEELGVKMREWDLPRRDLNTELFTLSKGKITKAYLFGKPQDDKQAGATCLLNGGDYANGIYATVLVTEADKDSATAQLVWIDMK